MVHNAKNQYAHDCRSIVICFILLLFCSCLSTMSLWMQRLVAFSLQSTHAQERRSLMYRRGTR